MFSPHEFQEKASGLSRQTAKLRPGWWVLRGADMRGIGSFDNKKREVGCCLRPVGKCVEAV